MFDIGFAEILIVAVVALVVLGPEKLPIAVRTVGLWVSRIRRTVGAIQSEISEELRIDEVRRTTSIKKEELDKELDDMRRPFENFDDEEALVIQGGQQSKNAKSLKSAQPSEDISKADK